MKKVKFWFRLITELGKKYWHLVLIGMSLGALIFYASDEAISLIKVWWPKTERIGVAGRYRLDNLDKRISKLVSYGLTEILPNKKATSSAIISSWEIKNEGKEYTFYLKPNISWQDGSSLEAKDIAYNIAGATFYPGENEVKIELESPFSPLPSFLNQPLFKNKKIGLADYKIKRLKLTGGNFESLLLVKGENTKERKLFKFYPDEKALITAFNLGEIDEIWGVTDIQEFEGWENITVKTEKNIDQTYTAVFFNLRKDLVNEKRFRQALSYATPKSGSNRAIGPIPSSSWAYNSQIKAYDFDTVHARKLMDDNQLPREGISLQFYTLPELLGEAEKIKEAWLKELGIASEIHVISFVPNTEQFDVFLGYGIVPSDPDQYFFWHSTQENNLTGIANPKIDQLLEKGRKSIDPNERKEVYQEFQKTLLEEAPAIFLSYPPSYIVERI